MTTREEIKVVAGFDNTAIAQGLRSTKTMIKEWAGEIAGMIGTGMMIAGFQKVLEKVDAIKNSASQTGFSTEGIQKFQYAVNQLGLNAGTANYALMYLQKNLGEATNGAGKAADRIRRTFEHWGINYHGKSTEQVFYEIMDAMQKMADPAQRSAMAMELMSTDGVQLLPILEKGRAAFEGMTNHAPLFSEQDLANLEEAKKSIADLQDRTVVIIGKTLAWFGTAASQLGSWWGNSSGKSLWRSYWAYGPDSESVKYAAPTQAEIKAAEEALKHRNSTSTPGVDAVTLEVNRRKAELGLLTSTPQGMAGYAKVEALKQQAAGLVALSQMDAGNLNYYLQDQIELGKKIVELAQAKKSADEESLQMNKQLTDLQRQQGKMQAEQKYVRNQELTGGKLPSVEELAGGFGFMTRLKRAYGLGGQFDLTRGPFKGSARELETLQYQYAWNVLHPGVNSQAFMSQQADRIESLKKVFVKAGIISPEDVYKTLMDNMQKNQEAINDLRARMKGAGIPVSIASN